MPDRSLTDFIEEVTGDSHLRVEDDLGDGFVVLRITEAERRQARHDVRSTEDIVIEMLRNARDAHARTIFVATAREGTMRHLTMIDDGDGIPEHMRTRIFDARVTSKLDTVHVDTWGVHGRGMALYAVRMNAREAFVAASKVGGGSSFVVRTDVNELPEKSDQSSLPVFSLTETGTVRVTGTRNINRIVAEFAYVDRDTCTVYLGSPVEIAATLWERGRFLLSASMRAFCDNVDSVDVCKRLAIASSPEDFAALAQGIGLDISERSARRIMDGTIEALDPVADKLALVADGAKQSSPSARKRTRSHLLKDARGLKLSKQDKVNLSEQVKQAFQPIAEAYYLQPDIDVSVSVRKDGIHIHLPVEKLR